MAAGILGKADLAAATNTKVYAVPSSANAELTIRMVNRNAASVTVRLAIADALTPTDLEWLEYDTTLDGKGVLINDEQEAQGNKLVVAYASATGVSVTVMGRERVA